MTSNGVLPDPAALPLFRPARPPFTGASSAGPSAAGAGEVTSTAGAGRARGPSPRP